MVSTKARNTVVAVVVAALAVGGWLEWRHKDYHEQISGAHGPFPATLGKGAPAAPDRVLPRTADSYGVDGPLALDTAKDGIVARDLRTGKEFWHYGRDHTELGQVGFTSTDDTVATWWEDGVVAGTDLRSGKPRWHAKVTYTHDDSPQLQLIDGLVVAYSQFGITAFSEDSGKRAWNGAIPHACRLNNKSLLAAPDALVASAQCTSKGDDEQQLMAFDSRTGKVRWQLAVDAPDIRQVDGHTLAALLWKGRLSAVIDVSGRKPVVTTMPAPTDHLLVAAGAGIMLSTGDADPSDWRLVAYGISDARPRWKRLPAKGTRFGLARIADGRVYVVQQPQFIRGSTPKAGRSDLLVLDARTGRQLHDMPLPAMPADDESAEMGGESELVPWQTGGGSITIRWDGMFGGLTEDLLVVTQ